MRTESCNRHPASGGSARGLAFWILASAFCLLSGEIIDRIAISVGTQVITESQIEEDLRLTEFLNQDKLNLSLDDRKKAAARLIEQALVRREIELSHYPMPELADSEEALVAIKARFASDAEYKKSLAAYGLSVDALQQRLLWQASFLRFIDYRFRPGIQIADADIQAYYQQQLEKWKQEGKQPVPAFEDVRSSIEETLTEQRIDQAIDRWLADTRTQVRIRFVDEALQ